MERIHDGLPYRISDSKEELQPDVVIALLRSSYWAGERSEEMLRKSWEQSLCFGVYSADGLQVGFMRVITDGATFSWLCDVIVHPEHRGQGLGKWMMAVAVELPPISHTSIYLNTRDAHGLYEKYGFMRQEMMVRRAAQ
ncbi:MULTISPECIES: GNAT family N-acetyltransferase [unclassified Paenibacillus]|uniref:GNAT family N-acetyltransferase n=1 Tax=unclassified Paenibacillus TaxID=185978 RepID=UPI0009553165|nr:MULTISPECIES: GNAT family N-acetyltransferase [unclassified Paenibacillus]ASS68415.1 GNAT family N-acetyltransferase [Paenibacillus sp. RUD330]SIR32397.1 Ribosomal protein S18 acetylase RimI [Paenibacillus sp. RU4X]SIR43690.1 Ribosomal protein S18 acetylase RimI [Paenibacillus sp. RU4T]